ncbi:hypothetical protein PBAL39_14319 [Pedobacter sp. BAL39]|uniref:histidine phosphatase family protein n=1 Tax=Pedobacter sp. BAL39 TaxID=391596 RepID=UPI000155AD68|nr:histidine phosphatase family protein [Pedobacter sp. BAL39]EDM34739.1 hypothetical protein PBAL39_14319 [Pedobacter sp. BAL39]
MKRIQLITFLLISWTLMSGASPTADSRLPDRPVKDILANDLTIVIMRHAEKPASGDNLSCKGFNRSLQLPAVLRKKFGVPNYVYVPAPATGKETKSGRMIQTVWPLATKYNLTINTSYEVKDAEDLVKNVKTKKGTVLVVWEHDAISDIIKKLGVKGGLKWPGSDYDGLWVVTIRNGKTTFSKSTQGLNPSANCAF